ncbi:hypothetical protein PJ15_0404 [Acinetobacter sp. neg1]|uniref:Uncharacterized protein n=1 Tax=Acinetobacter vivianii TaxID=1776742 RepID=N8UYG0_9GAMM|nr:MULTISPECIES: hypothetical protein [Acinetobacter]ENU92581.1 hypothetical protein F971_01564 [Acinetobacter vivianii]KHF76678.1 hypothetical protein PJ15_0404 [Acinetobacter sp. neg1]MEB6667980.1 hypothetical protein [Acinetobacter vivianii]OEC90738.1 hypothetical protein A9Z07_03085 [Acinetobacter sp. YK3]
MNENELLEIQQELQAQEKRLNYILSSKRRIQNMILSFEKDLAEQLIPVIDQISDDKAPVESSLALTICWKFSKAEFPKTEHWCSELSITDLEIKDQFTVALKAQAWLGILGSDELWQTPMCAEITLDPKTDGLKRYHIHFLSKGKVISLRKNSKHSVTVKQMQSM